MPQIDNHSTQAYCENNSHRRPGRLHWRPAAGAGEGAGGMRGRAAAQAGEGDGRGQAKSEAPAQEPAAVKMVELLKSYSPIRSECNHQV